MQLRKVYFFVSHVVFYLTMECTPREERSTISVKRVDHYCTHNNVVRNVIMVSRVMSATLAPLFYKNKNKECPTRFLGIIGQDPSVSKSSQLHVDIFFFTNLRYIF